MRIRTLFLVVPQITLLALASCAGSQASTREEAATTGNASQQQGMQAMAGMCPMGVQGTKVEANNTDNGAALTFTTTGDVAELRRRVTAMAEMHNAMAEMHNAQPSGQGMAGCTCPKHEGEAKACDCPAHGAGPGQGGSGCPACAQQGGQACPHCQMQGAEGQGMKMGMHMPASRATTEEVPGGMRLVLTPVDATQLDALRESVRHHAERMGSGQCPMMQAPPAHGG
jgi:hypothetical protein